MGLNNLFKTWSATMAKIKKAIDHLRNKKEIKVELIPVYLNEYEFQNKKDEVQNLLSSILISSHKRGRPTKSEMEDYKNAA